MDQEENTKKIKLTPKQERFCEEYLIDLNKTQAAIRAGYSKDSAHSIGEENLRKPEIIKRVDELKALRQESLLITPESVLKELYDLAMVDITEAYDDAGWLKPLSEIPKNVRRAIAGLEVNELFDGQGDDKHIIGVAKKIKFYDKNKSLEMLGRHLKMFTDKKEVSGADGGPIQVKNVSDLSDEELDLKLLEYAKKLNSWEP